MVSSGGGVGKAGLLDTLLQLTLRLTLCLFIVGRASQLPTSNTTTDIRYTVARTGVPRVTRGLGEKAGRYFCVSVQYVETRKVGRESVETGM